jgi:hypothetical protein
MHVRIRQRRESVGAGTYDGEGATRLADVLEMMAAIEARAVAIHALDLNENFPALIAAITSSRRVVEMSARSAETAKLLMPCVNAAILHVRSELSLIGRSLSDRAKQECDPGQPHAQIMASRPSA